MQRMRWVVAILLTLLSFFAMARLSPPQAALKAAVATDQTSVKAAPQATSAADKAAEGAGSQAASTTDKSAEGAGPQAASATDKAPVKAETKAAIARGDATVRSEPSTNAREIDELDAGDVFSVVGTVEGEKVSGGNGVWLKTDSGGYVYSGAAKMQQSGSKYIDVDLGTHTARAIENRTIVHVAPVVLGQPGWPTPVGQFRITDRVSEETMDSTVLGIPIASPGGFSYPNVRYVQYVDGGIALHTNYWVPDSAFGHADLSHGCVGFRLADAKFFWDFADVGTPVFIHD